MTAAGGYPPDVSKGGHISAGSTFALDAPTQGAWVAWNYDSHRFVIFATEVEALRYALSNHMQVRFQKWGEEQ